MLEPECARREVGLGTAYERWAFYRLLERWTDGRSIATALEGPLDGVAGMPGLHLLPLARRGTRVTVAHDSPRALQQVARVYRARGLSDRLDPATGAEPLRDRTFDLVLSFNGLPLVERWRDALAAIVARSAGLAIIVVTNPDSYGARLCRLLLPPGAARLFDHEATRKEILTAELNRHGKVIAVTHLDCPWWPDLFVPTGETLLGATLGQLPLLKHQLGRPRRWVYDAETFPFFAPGRDFARLLSAIERHPTFDGRGPLLGALFGHHLAYLLRRTA